MNTSVIDKAFNELINKRAVHNELGISSDLARRLRSNFNNGINISTDRKLQLLQKSGWRQPQDTFTKKELFEFAKHWHRCSQAKKNMGIEYVFENWEKR